MSLRLIAGGSGAGKTEYIYRNIIERSIQEPDSRFFVIVPEQATMQAQKEIVRLHPCHGTLNIDIVSFERLAYRIFSELSLPQPEVLDDTGKTMVLRKLAGEKKNELTYFSSQLHRAGFIEEMKSMLSELYQYGVTPELLKEQLLKDGVSHILTAKLTDMNILYRTFQDFIKEKYITLEELLDVLCRVAGRSKLLRDSIIVLDGYTGFTPVQYRLLGQLLVLSRELYVTVTVTEGGHLYGPANETDLFDMSRKMAAKLKNLAGELQVPILEDVTFGHRPFIRFKDSPALDYLERTMFRYPYLPYKEATEELVLVQAENPADEVDFAVNQIERLVKEEGLRYRDIAIICGDLPGYGKEIIHQFEERRIPLFLDETRDVSGNPFIRLIKSVLDILQTGFDYESMFRYLRTGLVTGETEQVDRMEVYVRALGIRGFKRWDEPWERVFEGGSRMNLVELNAFKEEIMGPLRRFKARAGERGVSVAEVTAALTELLSELQAEAKLLEKSREFKAAGQIQEAREYEEIHGLVLELFGRLAELLGEEAVSRREYMEILAAGLSELSVGMLPASVDRVVAGDLKRTRLQKVQVLLFLGVNEGVVPGMGGSGGLLTEQERELLKKNSLELAPTAREEGFMQRFYLYLMMTKPGKRLILSWPSLSAEGKTMRPSSVIAQLQKRFPMVPVRRAGGEKSPSVSLGAARRAVLSWLQEPEQMAERKEYAELYRWLSNEGGQQEAMERLAEACVYAYRDQGIGYEAAKELYGNVLNGSVTRMEGYAACAFAHFLTHGLGLHRRQEYELDLSDMGNLFHRSIDLFFSEVAARGEDFRTISDGTRRQLVKACVAKVSYEYRNTIMKSSARNAYLERKVERIADRTIRALIYQIRKGDFEPEAFEVDVSTRIPLKGGEALNLKGRIDRMDILEDTDKVYVKIMDYKSGSTSFDLALLYHGLQLQLVVYMDAALRMEEKRYPGKKAVPAGIFYYHIDDPVLERQEGMTEEDIEAGILRKLRMDGLVNSSLEVIRHLDREIEKESDVIPVAIKDGIIQEAKSQVAGGKRFEALSAFVNRSLQSMGEEILDGNVAANPYKQGSRTACDYCPYHSICGFDLKTSGYGFRRFRSKKNEEIWAEIVPEDEAETENENVRTRETENPGADQAEAKKPRTARRKQNEGEVQ